MNPSGASTSLMDSCGEGRAEEETVMMVWVAVAVGAALVVMCSVTVLRKWGRRRG
ncbi:hypothetical protein ACFXAF_13350 [Kitasatospora sp. NPDC059463]|uniref:hypothetical protein n=1 Tax=Kitasatospora sp. NPDC059463 TaxID=3346842 RepID=UPI0036CF294D